MYGWGEERKNACMGILSVGGSIIYDRTSKAKEEWKEVHYWEKWWSRLACWERESFRTTFSSQIASDHSAMNTNWKRPEKTIPYGNRTRVFDMKRRCPNHWTKGTKKPFFIYLSSENRSGSFCFYTQFKISFVFWRFLMWIHSAGRPPFLRVPPPEPAYGTHDAWLQPLP